MPVAYLNGTFLPVEQAQISVLDRGFLFGDGVYEVIPVYGWRLFRLARFGYPDSASKADP